MAESLMREVFQDARSVPAFAEPTRRIKTNAFSPKLGVKRKWNKSLFGAKPANAGAAPGGAFVWRCHRTLFDGAECAAAGNDLAEKAPGRKARR
jgi:hypothetical protein